MKINILYGFIITQGTLLFEVSKDSLFSWNISDELFFFMDESRKRRKSAKGTERRERGSQQRHHCETLPSTKVSGKKSNDVTVS
jgi:hypothetical protein